jgi:negative regulator of sigma E activity
MIKVTAFVLSTVLFSGLTQAACKKPEAPFLPDAATAVTAQMVKAKNDVTVYLAEAQAYLNCARGEIKQNRMIKAMEKVGEEFNLAVRTYKARMNNR